MENIVIVNLISDTIEIYKDKTQAAKSTGLTVKQLTTRLNTYNISYIKGLFIGYGTDVKSNRGKAAKGRLSGF